MAVSVRLCHGKAVFLGFGREGCGVTCRLLAFLFLVLFPVFKIRLVLPRVLSYEKVIALVAEAHVMARSLLLNGKAEWKNFWHSRRSK